MLPQSLPSGITPCVPTDDAKPIFRIMEISELAIIRKITSLRNSIEKDDYGLDTTFLIQTRMLSVKHGILPTTWKVAVITPVW